MTRTRRVRQALLLVAAGGCLLQAGSCATLIAPTVLALGEQILLSQLFTLLPIF